MSGRPGSNWPPIAWKAIALPNELLPHKKVVRGWWVLPLGVDFLSPLQRVHQLDYHTLKCTIVIVLLPIIFDLGSTLRVKFYLNF